MSHLRAFHHRGGIAGFPAAKAYWFGVGRERSVTVALANGGSASMMVQEDDPEVPYLEPGDVVHFEVDGVAAFAMLIDQIESVALGEKDADKSLVLTGPSHLAVLRRGLVVPPRDASRDPIMETITYDYSHPDYDDSAWPFANVLTDVASMQVDTGGGWGPWAGWAQWAPDRGDQMGFRPTDAGILGPSDGTILGTGMGAASHYFRDTFSTGTYDGPILFFFNADNTGMLSVNGKRFLSVGTDGDKQTSGFLEPHAATISSSAGTVTVAVEVTNLPPVTLHNPVGFSASAWIPGYGPDNPPLLLWSSSGGMRMLEYQDEAPGMTFGRASRLALEAEQNAGRLTFLTLNYDDDVDSDGTSWPVVNISTNINVSLYDLFVECMAVHVDAVMDPSSWTVNAWVKGDKGGASGLVLDPATNLTTLRHVRVPARASALSARWKGGYREYGTGTAHESVTLGSQETVQEVDRALAAIATIHANPREQVSASYDPSDTSETPFVNPDVTTGATVTVPDDSGAPLTARILEVTISEDGEDTHAKFALVIQDVILGEQERILQAITR